METDRFRNDKVRRAVIDTNVLMYIYLNKVDVISQLRDYGICKFVITESVLGELEKLERNLRGREKIAARFARRLIEDIGFEIVETKATGDSSLIEAAERLRCAIITNDKMLKKRAKAKKIPLGYLKGYRKVVVEIP